MQKSYVKIGVGVVLIGIPFYFMHEYHKNRFLFFEKYFENKLQQLHQKRSIEPQNRSIQDWCSVQSLIKDSVVQVISQIAQFDLLEPYKTPAQGQVFGSAFFINQHGELITNSHVINQARAVFVQIPSLGKQRFEVKVIGICPERDLALLCLTDSAKKLLDLLKFKISFLHFGNSDQVYRAQEIMTLGYPLGQQSLKSTTGVVSGSECIGGQLMIQISAPINPGNSGGPSLNRKGEVVGVNTSGFSAATAQNINYIIPSNEVELFLRQVKQRLQKNKEEIVFLRKPYLGIIYSNSTEEVVQFLHNPPPGGMYVAEVRESTPIYKAGIKQGDMIYAVDGHPIDLFGDMNVVWSEDKISVSDYVSRLTFGDTISLLAYRKGKKIEVACTLEYSDIIGIKRIFPGYEKIDYELIGGMVIMQLSLNHIQLLLPIAPELSSYTNFENQFDSALVITHIMPDSVVARSRNLGVGAIIAKVNGETVKTLKDFRKSFAKKEAESFVTITTKENVFAVFSLSQMLKEEEKLSKNYFYTITPFVLSLLKTFSNTTVP